MGMLFRYHTNNSDIETENTGAPKEVAPSPSTEKKEVVRAKDPEISPKDIKAMNGNKVRKLAKEQGIENPEELTVGELKAILCEKFG